MILANCAVWGQVSKGTLPKEFHGDFDASG